MAMLDLLFIMSCSIANLYSTIIFSEMEELMTIDR